MGGGESCCFHCTTGRQQQAGGSANRPSNNTVFQSCGPPPTHPPPSFLPPPSERLFLIVVFETTSLCHSKVFISEGKIIYINHRSDRSDFCDYLTHYGVTLRTNIKWQKALMEVQGLKGTVHPQIKNTYFSSYLQCYLSIQIVLEISAVEISIFSQI